MDLSSLIGLLSQIDFSFLKDYITANPSIFVIGTTLGSIAGIISAFLIPYLYKLIEKISKRELSKDEKRNVVTWVSIAWAAGIILAQFDFTGTLSHILINLLFTFLYFLTEIKGMIQLIYEKIIKANPDLDKKLNA